MKSVADSFEKLSKKYPLAQPIASATPQQPPLSIINFHQRERIKLADSIPWSALRHPGLLQELSLLTPAEHKTINQWTSALVQEVSGAGRPFVILTKQNGDFSERNFHMEHTTASVHGSFMDGIAEFRKFANELAEKRSEHLKLLGNPRASESMNSPIFIKLMALEQGNQIMQFIAKVPEGHCAKDSRGAHFVAAVHLPPNSSFADSVSEGKQLHLVPHAIRLAAIALNRDATTFVDAPIGGGKIRGEGVHSYIFLDLRNQRLVVSDDSLHPRPTEINHSPAGFVKKSLETKASWLEEDFFKEVRTGFLFLGKKQVVQSIADMPDSTRQQFVQKAFYPNLRVESLAKWLE